MRGLLALPLLATLLLASLSSPRRLFASAAGHTAADLYATLFTTFAPPAERQAFWERVTSSAQLNELQNHSSLPPLGLSFARVAICVTGGARGFPLLSTGIAPAMKRHIVDALGANQTDFFYNLELNDFSDGRRMGGSFNYTMADLAAAFALLPPRSATFSVARPRLRCLDGCYSQFLKLDQCLDQIKETEMVEGIRYDFVVRQRPDYLMRSDYPNVFSLKRAAYVGRPGAMKSDDSFFTHRDFADAALGMTRLVPFSSPPVAGQSECYFSGDIVAYIRSQQRVCGNGAMCECWLKLSLLVHNATVVIGPRSYVSGVVRGTTPHV